MSPPADQFLQPRTTKEAVTYYEFKLSHMILTVQMERSLNNVIFSHMPWGAIYHILSSILMEVKMINFSVSYIIYLIMFLVGQSGLDYLANAY